MKTKKSLLIIAGVLMCTASISSQAAPKNQIAFPLSKYSTKDNLQEFFCTATKVDNGTDDTIRITNWAQMIKGFDANGILLIKPDKLNKVFFQAYHDPDPGYKNEDGNVIVAANGYDIKCDYGSGSGRTLIDGPFGSRH